MPRFTEGFADSIAIEAGQREVQVFDDALPGFGIRKFASGRASYFVKYNIGRKQRKLTLGSPVPGNLADMRRQASQVLARARLGQDIVAEKRSALGKRASAIGGLIDVYLSEKRCDARPRYLSELKRQLERDWKSLHHHDATAVTRLMVVDVVDRLAKTSGPTAADRARMALGVFFGWAIERAYCETNPTMHIAPRARPGGRDRVLSESELVEIWHASGSDSYGCIVRLLILTGQRRDEIGGIELQEVDLIKRKLELPADRVKNHRPHLVPLATPDR